MNCKSIFIYREFALRFYEMQRENAWMVLYRVRDLNEGSFENN
jgi:hypothetical protein